MIIFIPWIIFLIIIFALVGITYQALNVNLMPILTIISIISIIVGIVMTSVAEEDGDEGKKIMGAITILISVLLLFISMSSSCTAGEIISCLWYSC